MKALERAREHIMGLLSQPHIREGERLPTTARMARDAGVCTVTMSRAVKALAAENVLDARPRAGIRAGPGLHERDPVPPGKQPQPSLPRRRVMAAVERDVLAGRFRPGAPLPPVSMLAAEHGVCAATMRRVLDTLVERGTLSLEARRYVVHPGRVRHRGIVLCRFWQDYDTLRILETETARAGAQLVTAPLFRKERFLSALREARQGTVTAPLLGVITVVNMHNPSVYLDTASLVKPTGRPLAIIDTGACARRANLPANRLIRIVSPPAEHARGTDVARYLLELGHRRIVYLCPQHDARWSQERLAGIVDTYDRAGPGHSVEPATERNAPDGGGANAGSNVRLGYFWELLTRPTPAPRQVLLDSIDRIQRTIQQSDLLERTQSQLMARALQLRDVTAWVASNDRVALRALAFLQRKGTRVPDELSVVGFDNSPEAMREGLTSYGHDNTALVLAALTHVLDGGNRSLRARMTPFVQVNGIVAIRLTTASARLRARNRGREERESSIEG
jgi:DNA-binding transcriptional regulator YhcF (GntR family)